MILIESLHFVTMWLNSFPVKNGVSQKYILSWYMLNAKLHHKAPFVAYCDVHDGPETTNAMEVRTYAAICLGPTINIQGSYNDFFSNDRKRLF